MNTETVLSPTAYDEPTVSLRGPACGPRECPLTIALDGTGDGAFATDGSGRIVGWNRAAERMLGYSAHEVTGRSCCQVLDASDGFGNRMCAGSCHVRTLLRRPEPIHPFDLRARSKDGRLVWINMSVLATAGDSTGGVAVHVMRDVTETKQLLSEFHERVGAGDGDAAALDRVDLTRRELEILRLLVAGVSTASTAERLHVSQTTVRNHVQRVLTKLGVHSRLEAVAWAARNRLF